jgi:Ca2+-binding RTX toxin-like protein
MKRRNIWFCMSLLAALALAPVGNVSAQQVPLPNAYTAMGQFGTNQQAYLVSFNVSTGQCARRAIGGPSGLNANTFVTGWSSSDFIFAISTVGASHCGSWGTMSPLNTNFFTLSVNAGGSNDVVDGGFLFATRLGGDSADDYVISNGTNTQLFGWTGNDILYGSWGATIRGEGDNDTMCAVSGTTVNQFIGGTGTDTYCGAFALPPSSASLNCGSC